MSELKHALDPLNATEIQCAVDVVRDNAGLDPSAWFETVTLHEPEKNSSPNPSNRKAYVCCYEPSSNRTLRGIVDLANGELLTWEHVEGS